MALATAVPLGFGLAAEEVTRVDRRPATAVAFVAVGPAIVAYALPRGLVAAGLALPWLVAAAVVGVGALVRLVTWAKSRSRRSESATLGFAVAAGFLAVAAGWAVIDRLGVRPFAFGTTIVLLTAVHFHVAGFVLTLAAVLAARARPTPISVGAVIGLIAGTPLTALGFFGLPAINWIGAMVVAISGIGVGLATVATSGAHACVGASPGRRWNQATRFLLRVAGATLFLTMPLAAAYATGTTFGIPFLDVPAMAAIHGGLNVVGFAIPAMLGWSLVAD